MMSTATLAGCHQLAVPTIGASQGEITEQARRAEIQCGVALPNGRLGEGTGDVWQVLNRSWFTRSDGSAGSEAQPGFAC
jgi:hypothetical protein